MYTIHILLHTLLLMEAYASRQRSQSASRKGHQLSSRHQISGDLGTPAGIKEYPFLVAIEKKNGPLKCAGAILSSKYVLTAARCHVIPPKQYVIRTGLTMLTPNDGQSYNVKNIIVHPGYEKPRSFDAALFEIDGEIQYSYSAYPVPLLGRTDDIYDEMTAEVVGWGDKQNSRSSGPETPVYLMKASETLMTFNSCRILYPKISFPEDLACSNPQSGRTACMRPSGSSLVDDGKLYGILLADFSCGFARLPKIYINIGEVREWIMQVTGIKDKDADVTFAPAL